MDKIPGEVLLNILLRLPPMAVQECRLVSKQWRSIVYDPQFTRDYFTRANNLMRRISVNSTCFRSLYSNKDLTLSFLHPKFTDSFSFGRAAVDSAMDSIELDKVEFLSSYAMDSIEYDKLEFLSSYYGLLLVGAGKKDHFLWNPCTQSYRVLPRCRFYHYNQDNAEFRYFRLYGLCYDSVMETYKIIRMVRIISNKQKCPDINSSRVYNSKTDSWEKVKSFDKYQLIVNGQGANVNGVPHWVVALKGYEHRKCVIIYYNVKENAVMEVAQLPPWFRSRYATFRLGVFEESLCLVNNMKEVAEVWVMRYQCWTKLFKITCRMPWTLNYTIFDKIMQDSTPFYRKNCDEITCELVKVTESMISESTGSTVFYTETFSVNVHPWTNQVNADQVFAFDGPYSDYVFDNITCVESSISIYEF